jgi:predicted RND superfamily exporter protein
VLAGPAVFSEAINEWSQRGLPLATGLILAIGAVTLYLTTRRVRPAAEGLTAVFSSQLVLVGAIAWTGRAMDMMLSMTPPLMMALGYSFAAHRALRRGANRALLLSMVTTCLSLLSFTLTDFAPIRSFAWYGAAGVVVTWAAVMLLVTPPDSAVSDCPIHAIPVPPRNNRAWAMMLTGTGLAVTLAGIWLAGLIHVEQDVLRAFPPDAGIARDYRLLNDELTGMLPFEVRVVGDADPSPMLRDTPGVRRVVPLPKTLTAPRTGRWYLGFADNDALPGLVASQRDWQAWAKSNHVELEWAGVAAQIDHIGRSVMRAARRGVPMMALIAGLAAWMIDRRWSTALLSIYVNLFPLSMLIIGVVVMRHPVGLPTLVIASLAIGIAIDDTLHLLCVRRAYGSMSAAVRACRRPCLGSSLAVALCTAMLGLCAFHPTAEFGLIVSAVVLVAALGDLVLLPAAVVALGKD